MFIVTLHLAGPVLCNKLSGVSEKVYLSETLPDGFIWHFAILFPPGCVAAPVGNREHLCKLSTGSERAHSEWPLTDLLEGQFDLAENNGLVAAKLIWKCGI